jgi:hypothetical protein
MEIGSHWTTLPSNEEIIIMRKAIRLLVKLWIEAEDQPAHDFGKTTIEAVRDIIQVGSSSHPEMRVTVRSITEDDSTEDF